MPASILPPESAPAGSALGAAVAHAEAVMAGWPSGRPTARLVQEYLVGRSAGALDVSGRRASEEMTRPASRETTAGRSSANDRDRFAEPVPSDSTAPPGEVIPALTLVLDDADGSLTLASATVVPCPHLVRCDSAAAGEAVAEVTEVITASGAGRTSASLPTPRIAVVRDTMPTAPEHPLAALCQELRRRMAEVRSPGALDVPAPRPAHPGADASGGPVAPRERGAAGERPLLRVVIAAPKQVEVLREVLGMIHVAVPGSEVEVIVAGREKHMTRAFNRELAKHFARVDVSPGLAKSRLLIGSGSGGGVSASPAVSTSETTGAPAFASAEEPGGHSAGEPGREASQLPGPHVKDGVAAFGACFGGTGADGGARLLLHALRERSGGLDLDTDDGGRRRASRILDLGCGNGWLLREVGKLFPGATLAGTDDSWAAAASARVTVGATATGGETTADTTADDNSELTPRTRGSCGRGESGDCSAPIVLHADGTAPLPWHPGFEAERFDLVVLNPPFHEGTAVTTDLAHMLIDSAYALLRPGGLLVLVHNSHLRYRGHLAHRFAEVEQWARDRRFTVLASRKG